MGRSRWSAVLCVVLGLVVPGWAHSRETGNEAWRTKVDPWVLSTAATNGNTEFLLFLQEQASVHAATSLTSKEAKGEFVSRTLRETATRTQAPILDALKGMDAEFRPYWIANMIWVRGNIEVIRAMAERPDVLRVSANPRVKLQELPPDPPQDLEAPAAIEWGITTAGAQAHGLSASRASAWSLPGKTQATSGTIRP